MSSTSLYSQGHFCIFYKLENQPDFNRGITFDFNWPRWVFRKSSISFVVEDGDEEPWTAGDTRGQGKAAQVDRGEVEVGQVCDRS